MRYIPIVRALKHLRKAIQRGDENVEITRFTMTHGITIDCGHVNPHSYIDTMADFFSTVNGKRRRAILRVAHKALKNKKCIDIYPCVMTYAINGWSARAPIKHDFDLRRLAFIKMPIDQAIYNVQMTIIEAKNHIQDAKQRLKETQERCKREIAALKQRQKLLMIEQKKLKKI